MTTRVQALRSSTSGNVPAAGTRLPGELWTNFADLQMGVIDAAKNAQKLVAVRFFSTSANYAAGDFVVQAGKIYAALGAVTAGAFNPSQWSALADSATYMPVAGGTFTGPIVAPAGSTIAGYLALSGGTLTGPLVLAADPIANLQAATKQYADKMLPLIGGTLTGPLILAADPSVALGAATKQYADKMVPLAGGTMTGKLTLSGPPTNSLDAATKAYTDGLATGGPFLPLAGGTLTGPLVLAADPAAVLQPATKQYADTKLSLAGGTMTGPITPAGVVGVTNGSNAAAGQLGEVISSVVLSPGVTLTTATFANVTSISLTAGDWDVDAELWLQFGSAGGTSVQAAISLTTAAAPSAPALNVSRNVVTLSISGSALQIFPLKTCRMSLAATTTVFFVAAATFTSGASTAYGTIWARRVR